MSKSYYIMKEGKTERISEFRARGLLLLKRVYIWTETYTLIILKYYKDDRKQMEKPEVLYN